MKNSNTISAIILLAVMAGCGGSKQSADDIIIVDVTKSYPDKELILQDFMDVEYIPLETNDEFVTQGDVLAIGKEIMLVKNYRSDGDIFVFDRNGKGLGKFNRWGQGPEEYISTFINVMLDEENNEIFIQEILGNNKGRIMVYDLFGKFLRSISKREGMNYSVLQNYDREHLIGRETTVQIDEKSTESQPYAIVSKKDGSMVKDIRIGIKQGINTRLIAGGGGMVVDLTANTSSIIPYHKSWILMELSSDTIFRLLPDYSITPFITRTPSVHSTNPELLLVPDIFTDRYYFLETFKKEVESVPGFFKRTKLAYDVQENTIYEYTVRNDDYSTHKMIDIPFIKKIYAIDNEIAFWQTIEAYQLVEAYKKGELKGRLKEISAELDEEDNPVIMLMKHKK